MGYSGSIVTQHLISLMPSLNIDMEAIRRWFITQLIKFKRIKFVSSTAEEINAMLAENLPENFEFPVPGCKGELEVIEAKVTMPLAGNYLQITLFCSMRIETMGNPIYRAHINISGIAWPSYIKPLKRIQLDKIKVQQIKLIQDEYALLKDTKQLLSMFVPGAIRSVLGMTMKTTLNVLGSTATTKDAQQYLSLYLQGNKQKVLDYHKPELEKLVTELNAQGELSYALEEDDFEEQLFARYGKSVRVKNGELQFVFHD